PVGPEALLHAGSEPTKQRHLGGLREDAEARLRSGDATAGCPDRSRIDWRLDRGLQPQPPALRAENALAPRVRCSSNRNRLSVRGNGGKTTRLQRRPRIKSGAAPLPVGRGSPRNPVRLAPAHDSLLTF